MTTYQIKSPSLNAPIYCQKCDVAPEVTRLAKTTDWNWLETGETMHAMVGLVVIATVEIVS